MGGSRDSIRPGQAAEVNRPSNPQAMANVSARKVYDGHADLGSVVDGDTWLTPRYILDSLGRFDLDPCAADSNPNWTRATYCWIRSDDGLMRQWKGRVFMNPPFSNTGPWIIKHARHGYGVSLVPASVESRVWRTYVWPKAKAILLLHGRTRFCNPDGSATTGRPLRSIALIAWSEFDAKVLSDSAFAGVLLRYWDSR